MNVNENRIGIFVQVGILLVGIGTIYQTVTAGQIRTESRLTKIETLVTTQHDDFEIQIAALQNRLQHDEDRAWHH